MKRILVVDDEPGNLEVATRRLEGLGHDVTTVDSVEAALALVEGGVGFDGIISDYDLGPHAAKGTDFLKQVRRNPDLNNVWFLLVSSYAHEADGTPFSLTVAQLDALFLQKPYTRDVLRYTLAERL